MAQILGLVGLHDSPKSDKPKRDVGKSRTREAARRRGQVDWPRRVETSARLEDQATAFRRAKATRIAARAAADAVA